FEGTKFPWTTITVIDSFWFRHGESAPIEFGVALPYDLICFFAGTLSSSSCLQCFSYSFRSVNVALHFLQTKFPAAAILMRGLLETLMTFPRGRVIAINPPSSQLLKLLS